MDEEIYLAFLDLGKGFNRLPRSVIEKNLMQRQLGTKLRRVIMSLYRSNRVYMRTDNLQSQGFPANEGIWHGDVLSPVLVGII